jgi:universal stress protein E
MKRFKNILCVVEPREISLAAIKRAVSLSQNYQARLTVVSTIQSPVSLVSFIKNKEDANQALSECVDNKRAALQDFVAQHCENMDVDIDIFVGTQFIEIVKDVLRNGRDLVIKCPNEESWLDRIFGGDDMHLLRKCPCPVLMLKPEMIKSFCRILATVDVSDSVVEIDEDRVVQEQLNREVLEFSSSFAVAESAELYVGSVWNAYGEDFLRYGTFSSLPEDKVDEYVEDARRAVSDKLDACIRQMSNYIGEDALRYIQPKVRMVKGLPAKEIPLMAERNSIDMIVMGTVSRTGVPGLIIGNTAEAILEQINCSVLAIKPAGFRCPILLDSEEDVA